MHALSAAQKYVNKGGNKYIFFTILIKNSIFRISWLDLINFCNLSSGT